MSTFSKTPHVQREIQGLGVMPTNARADSPEFHTVKSSIASLPAARKSASAGQSHTGPRGGPGRLLD